MVPEIEIKTAAHAKGLWLELGPRWQLSRVSHRQERRVVWGGQVECVFGCPASLGGGARDGVPQPRELGRQPVLG